MKVVTCKIRAEVTAKAKELETVTVGMFGNFDYPQGQGLRLSRQEGVLG